MSEMSNRYYFDIDNGQETIRDDQGVEANDLQVALSEARSVIVELADELQAVDLDSPWTIVVRDAAGSTVAHLPLGLFSKSQSD